jgi:hypothetical protein
MFLSAAPIEISVGGTPTLSFPFHDYVAPSGTPQPQATSCNRLRKSND